MSEWMWYNMLESIKGRQFSDPEETQAGKHLSSHETFGTTRRAGAPQGEVTAVDPENIQTQVLCHGEIPPRAARSPY